jgi:hypothetical protein
MQRTMEVRTRSLALAVSTVMLALAAASPSFAANIITFGDGANSCGGAVICSSNGTTGYLNNGTGGAFDLSTINSWFQIDTDGMNHLSTQTTAEPDGGAGGFLVLNDTGSAVTTFSLTIDSTQMFSTGCSITGENCQNFQADKPNGTYSPTSEALSGPNFNSCTNGSAASGYPCYSTAGQAAANFSTPGTVTYTWNLDIPKGDYFDISFASWNGSAYTSPTPTPEPASMILLGTFLCLSCWLLGKKRLLG